MRNAKTVMPYVDGNLVQSADSSTIDVVNPSTGAPKMAMPAGCAADANRAVDSSRHAFERGAWSDFAPSIRKAMLHRFAALVARNSKSLDELDAEEMGKPVSERFCNAEAASSLLQFYAEAVDKVTGDVYVSDRHSLVLQRRVARGVVAAVVPWNFPTFNTLLKVAPALAAGNCVIVKPSELSPSSAILLAQLAIEAQIPPGVFNVLPGLGETVGRALGLHRDVNMVAFTGSTETGKKFLRYASESNLKLVQAECGGKSPQIVFGDGVDLDNAARGIAGSLLINQGQLCSVGSRLLVHQPIKKVLLQKVVDRLAQVVIGDARHGETTFGPLASRGQKNRVLSYIELGNDEGAKRISTNDMSVPEGDGFYVAPVIFDDVPPNSRVAQEEIFGPVLAVTSFEDEAHAVELANSGPYGLVAYVWTSNLATGLRMAKSIRSSVLVNSSYPMGDGAGHAASAEPTQESGLGVEGGVAGLESYMRRQLTWFSH